MTFHNERKDVIETDDISDILGIHVTEENGTKVATIKACLDPRKDFLAVKDFFVHLTNGINHRLLGPFTAVDTPTDLPTVPAPAVEAVSEPEPESASIIAARAAFEPVTPTPSSETTQPLVETPASTEAPVAAPLDTTTSEDTDEETTVKVPTSDVVTTGNKKGN